MELEKINFPFVLSLTSSKALSVFERSFFCSLDGLLQLKDLLLGVDGGLYMYNRAADHSFNTYEADGCQYVTAWITCNPVLDYISQ